MMFELSLYMIILIVLTILSSLFFVNRVHKNRSTIPTLVLWIIFCIVIILIGFFPNLTDPIAVFFGLDRGLDFIIILGFAFCIFMIFKLYVKVDNMNQDISELIRQLAIEKEKFDSLNDEDIEE